MSCVQSRAHQLVSRAVLKFRQQEVFLLFPRLVTVPYFFARSSGSSAYRYGRPSWFHMNRGGWCRGLQRSVEEGENPPPPLPPLPKQIWVILIQNGRREAKSSISTILRKNGKIGDCEQYIYQFHKLINITYIMALQVCTLSAFSLSSASFIH